MKMQNEKIEFIFQILRENNIFTLEDILGLKRQNRRTLLYSKDYPWIGNICQIVNDFYDDTERFIEESTGQLFMVDQMSTDNHENLLKYSCIFPNRMIVNTGNLLYLNDPDQAFLDIQFFYKLFWGRQLFEKNLLRITPFYRRTELVPGEGNLDNCLTEYLTLPEENKKKIAELDRCGDHEFGQLIQRDRIFLMMPWLINADIDTYLEIIDKNKLEFEAYNLNLERIGKNADNIEVFLTDFDTNLKEANINIAIELEKKQKELKKLGLFTGIGIAITAIPFILPAGCPVDPSLLSKLMGGVDGIQIVNDIKEISQISSVGHENPFWVLWKWKNKSKRNE